MSRYEYRCRSCGATFELTRPMSESGNPCVCPAGHDDTVKLLSTVALAGRATASGGRATASGGRATASGGAPAGGGGGCCGGSCGCGG